MYHLLSRKGGVMLLLLLSFLCMRRPVSAQFVHTDGTQILDENGNDIYFSGMNLGNWLLWEGYLMMGDFNYRTHSQFLQSVSEAFGNDMTKAKEFEHQWRMNYLTQQGISDLKALGYNSVRVPFNYNMFWDGSAVTNHGFQYFDRVIEFCRNEGMYVMLDMHAAPGYQNPGDHSDNVNSNASQPRETVTFWDGNNVEIASTVWRHIANYYKNEPVVWGYDLINEPVPQPGREFELMASMIAMRNAIREVDSNHIIIAEGSWWGSDMQKLDWMDPETQNQSGIDYRWDNNMVYQTHHYSNDVSALDGRLAICNKLNMPMILGEYGESDNNNLRNMTDWCINNNVDYFPWSFKKMSHDKCLWTIHPNQPYEELKAFINNGIPPSASLYDDMIAFAQNNISNGSPGLTFDQGWYEATKPPCDLGAPANLDGGTPTPSQITLTWGDTANGEDHYSVSRNGATIATLPANSTSYVDSGLSDETCYSYTVTAVGSCPRGVNLQVCTPCGGTQSPYLGTAANLPGTIEAESFDTGCSGQAYFDTGDGNNGGDYRDGNVDISATVDGDSDYNVGWVEAGEWLEYTVDVSSSGTYYLSYRVATPESTGQIQLKVDGTTLVTTDIPATGDWNAWETVEAQAVDLSAGEQVIQIYFSGGSVNLNSFTLTSGAPNAAPVADAGADQSLSSSATSTTLDGSGSYDSDNGPSALTYVWTQTSGNTVSLSDATVESPIVSGLSAGNSYEFQLVVNDGSKSSAPSSLTVSVDQAPVSFPLRLEAENYSSQNGIQTEDCQEGGQNVGWIDGGDWIQFDNIHIPVSGTYTITYRVASQNNQGTFDLTTNNGSTNHGSVDVSESGSNGWQDWKSITQTVTLPAGSNDYRISITGGGFNINWFEIASGGVVIPNQAPVADAGSNQTLASGTTSTSLDGSGSSDPDAGPSSLTYSWTQLSGSNASISNPSDVSPTVSGLSDGNSYIFQLIVNDGEDDSSASTVTISVNNGSSGTALRIEAEDYFEMYGLQTENTSDTGGGQNVGWIDGGDWAGYEVDIPTTGAYTVSYRVASQNGGGQIQLEQFGGGTVFGSVNVSSTGGWQNWTTISHTVNLQAGVQDLALAFPSGGLNLNWIEISNTSGARIRTTQQDLDKVKLSLFPNPAITEVKLTGLGSQFDQLMIYGLMGEMKGSIQVKGLSETTIDVSAFSPGLYFAVLSQNGSAKGRIKFKVQ
ncbi:MAG: carbohydrate-binding protein [Reichenbachiella sp.]|uniref:carbohydrate-binding protein n=2 Tax=Reichenbachiella sp. TaxID=2184521 RepID=UPI003298BD55